jgi:hypothetical protein
MDKEITRDELAQNTGAGETQSFVAVDGTVYDVSASAMWKAGVKPEQTFPSKLNLPLTAKRSLKRNPLRRSEY